MKRVTDFFQGLADMAALIRGTVCELWNSCPKWFRRLIVLMLILVPAGFVVLFVYDWYDDEYGRCYSGEFDLSDTIAVHRFADSRYRVYDRSAGRYTTPRLSWVSSSSVNDSLTVYAIPGRLGFLNVNTGRIAIDAGSNDYRKAWVFSEGLAAVMKDGKVGFINTDNELVIPFRYDYHDMGHLCDFGYIFRDGYCVMTNNTGDVGLIDSDGEWVVEPKYDEIWAPDAGGYRVVVDEGLYGVLDSGCCPVYPVEYESLEVLSDGFVLVRDGRKWQEDFAGKVIHPFMFDSTYYLNYPAGYNECGEIQYAFADYAKYEVFGLLGVMNRITGEPVTRALYLEINMLSYDVFEVQDPETCDWYLIDRCGRQIPQDSASF